MFRSLSLLLAAALVLAACGGDTDSTEASPTTEPVAASGPEVALVSFLDALRGGNYAATAQYVDESQLALLASIESSDPDALVSMAESGVNDSVRTNFWSSFTEAIPGLAGADPDAVRLGEPEPFEVGAVQFVEVGVEFSETGASGVWVARQTESGEWVLDVISTFGAAFVNPLNGWITSLASADRSAVVEIVSTHTASWDALDRLQGEDEAGVAVGAALDQLDQLLAAPS